MIRAMIFDLDGTLVQTERLKALSYSRAAVALRPDLTEDQVFDAFRDFVGLSREEVATGLLRRFDLSAAAEARKEAMGGVGVAGVHSDPPRFVPGSAAGR